MNMYDKKPVHYALLQREAISQETAGPKGKTLCQVCRVSLTIRREIGEEMWKQQHSQTLLAELWTLINNGLC